MKKTRKIKIMLPEIPEVPGISCGYGPESATQSIEDAKKPTPAIPAHEIEIEVEVEDEEEA